MLHHVLMLLYVDLRIIISDLIKLCTYNEYINHICNLFLSFCIAYLQFNNGETVKMCAKSIYFEANPFVDSNMFSKGSLGF